MKRILAALANLPPEMRMLLALLGLGAPIGIIYFLSKTLKVSTTHIIIGLIVVVAVVSLIGFVISRLFGRGERRRRRQMEKELQGGAEGAPVSMDVRAAIKANNEKYFTAVRNMRKRLHISVYDMPWYIVIGDSGCGKTKLINESGLTFSTGRPEGYQLGTLNYNWWFTEDAIFIDMAGRLCNPQDDADRREWTAFLDTIGKGRRGFPINGAIVCISAEQLLQDPPEKQEQDANTALERLRDLQSKLGVTFATYLVVTKCDKILGFMQFFDRADHDITMKNQIFGWSKPGEFNQLYDPEQFAGDFDSIFARLNELRLRRLNDDADEIELGFAYSFPEEFRALREPLQIYIRTLFPMIRNPKAIKNLIFRGTYFTSATQQGSVILKHLAERLGPEAAERFEPLESLYPTPRPHFLKDLLYRKVFPEHGLVFRNEQQVMRNQRLSRLLSVGSVVLATALLGTVIVSSYLFSKLLTAPREHLEAVHAGYTRPDQALEGVRLLTEDVENLKKHPWPAFMLSGGHDASRPIEDLTTVWIRAFEEGVLKPSLAEVQTALAGFDIGPDASRRGTYSNVLTTYMKWWANQGGWRQADLAGMAAIVPAGEFIHTLQASPSSSDAPKSEGPTVIEKYFDQIGKINRNWVNPSKPLAAAPAQPIIAGVDKLRQSLEPRARLSDGATPEVVRNWMAARQQWDGAKNTYQQILAVGEQAVTTSQEYEAAREKLVGADGKSGLYKAFTQAMSVPAGLDLKGIKQSIQTERKTWQDMAELLSQAVRGSARPTAEITGAIGRMGSTLDGILYCAILTCAAEDAGLAVGMRFDPDARVDAAQTKYADMIAVDPAGALALTADAKAAAAAVWQALEPVAQTSTKTQRADNAPHKAEDFGAPESWLGGLVAHLDHAAERPAASQPAGAAWEPSKLEQFASHTAGWTHRAQGTRLLTTIRDGLAWAAQQDGGIGALVLTDAPAPAAPAAATDKPAEPKAPSGASWRDRLTRRSAAPAPDQRTNAPLTAAETKALTPAFLFARMEESAGLLSLLGAMSESDSLADTPALGPDQLRPPLDRYFASYVQRYQKRYSDTVASLDRLCATIEAQPWTELTKTLKQPTNVSAVLREMESGLNPAMEAVAFWDWQYVEPSGFRAAHWERIDTSHADWTMVRGWFDQYCQQAWPEAWAIQGVARTDTFRDGLVEGRNGPWEAVSRSVGGSWQNLCESIAATAVPKDFDANSKPPSTINWGQVEAEAKKAGLYAGPVSESGTVLAGSTSPQQKPEAISQRLMLFEKRTQQTLDHELMTVLAGLQEKHFPKIVPPEGWPFTGKHQSNAICPAVEMGPFKQFLREVGEAKRVLANLEANHLPNYPARHTFLSTCDAWSTFLGLPDRAGPTPLKLTIRSQDPMAGLSSDLALARDSAQFNYQEFQLEMGLKLDEKTSIPTFKTGAEGWREAHTVTWEWPALNAADTSTPQMVRLVLVKGLPVYREKTEPVYPDLSIDLGPQSHWALCGYLYGYGEGEGKSWVVTHWVNLVDEFNKNSTTATFAAAIQNVPNRKGIVGVRLAFEVDRPMPPPIVPLRPAQGS